MNRRTLLRGLAALSAGAAGCTDNNREVPPTAPEGPVGGHQSTSEPASGSSGTDAEPEQPFVVPNFDAVPADDGTVTATVTVENTLDRRHTAAVVVTVQAGGEEHVARRVVTLQGGASDTYRFRYDASYDDLEGLDVGFEEATPTAATDAGGDGGTAADDEA